MKRQRLRRRYISVGLVRPDDPHEPAEVAARRIRVFDLRTGREIGRYIPIAYAAAFMTAVPGARLRVSLFGPETDPEPPDGGVFG